MKTGDASSTLSFADSLELELTTHRSLTLNSADMILQSEVVEIDVNEASLEGLEDIANSFLWRNRPDYRMPLAAKVELSLSNSDTPLSDPEAVLVEVEIEAAPTRCQGQDNWCQPTKDSGRTAGRDPRPAGGTRLTPRSNHHSCRRA